MGASCICWCGFRHKGQVDSVYRCVRYDIGIDDEIMALAFERSGYLHPDHLRRPKAEIVVVSEETLRWAEDRRRERGP
jgi:hypothetical protein